MTLLVEQNAEDNKPASRFATGQPNFQNIFLLYNQIIYI